MTPPSLSTASPSGEAEPTVPSDLHDAVREAMHHRWDPIGVSAITNDLGEYDTYVTSICELLLAGCATDAIFAALWRLETEGMGLPGDRDATQNFASWIVDLANSRA